MAAPQARKKMAAVKKKLPNLVRQGDKVAMKRGRPAMAAPQARKKMAAVKKKQKKPLPSSVCQIFAEGGKPLAFYMPACELSGAICQMIEKGGGLIVDKPGGDVIHITPEGAQPVGTHPAVSTRFIRDSVNQRKRQTLQGYVVRKDAKTAAPAPSAPPAPLAPAAAPAPPAAPAPEAGQPLVCRMKVKARREKFSQEEDTALLKWVRSHPDLPSQGRYLWQRAQHAKVTKHSWQSMQNRFRRALCDKKAEDKPGAVKAAAKPLQDARKACQGEGSKLRPAERSCGGAVTIVGLRLLGSD